MLFQIFDEPSRIDNIRVLLGESLQQGIQVLLLRGEAGVNLWRRYLHSGLLQDAARRNIRPLGFFRLQLFLRRVPRVLCFTQLQLGLIELRGDLANTGCHVGTLLALQLHVLQAELLESPFGFFQLGNVSLDLFFDKLLGRVRVLSGFTQAGLNKD